MNDSAKAEHAKEAEHGSELQAEKMSRGRVEEIARWAASKEEQFLTGVRGSRERPVYATSDETHKFRGEETTGAPDTPPLVAHMGEIRGDRSPACNRRLQREVCGKEGKG